MSSPDPPHLRLSLPSTAPTFKRSFDQFGFDLEPPVDSSLVASSSNTDEHRPGPSNTDRNKRARSNSVTPNNANAAEPAHSVDTSPPSAPPHSTSSATSNHMTTSHRDPPPPLPTTRLPRASRSDSNDSVFSPGLSLGEEPTHTPNVLFESRSSDPSINPPASTAWSNAPSLANPSAEHNEQFRLSMERFHAFDSQISSIRARPSPLPSRPPPTLPPLTLSTTTEHPHAHINSAVSLPSVESFNYTASSAQPAAAPPPVAPPSIASPTIDQYPPAMSPLRFEEFGEFREIMGFFPEQNSNSRSVDRSTDRPRQSSTPIDNGRHRVDQPIRRSPIRQVATSTLRPWPVDHRSTIFGDSDDEFGDLPAVNNSQGRRPLDLPRSRLDPSLLADRIRRSMRNQAEALGRMSPPRFPTPPTSQFEPNQTRSANASRIQDHERPDRYEHPSLYPPSRRSVLPEAVRTLAERLGRGRQRADYDGEGGIERSRSPTAATFSGSTAGYDDWLFDLPVFASSESPYALDLPTPSSWIDEDISSSRPAMPSFSRIQRDASLSRSAPWRSSLPPSGSSEERFLNYLSRMHRVPSSVPPGEETQPGPVWRRLSSFSDYHPHLQPTRSSNGHGNTVNNTPLTRATHSAESPGVNTSQDMGMGWLRSLARAELNHERDTSSTPIAGSSFSDRPSAERSSASIRGFIERRPHLQPPSRIPLDTNTRRPSEVYRAAQPMEVTNDTTVDTDSPRPDESPEVPFSSHAAALFASRGTSNDESTPLRHPDFIDLDRMSTLPVYPRGSRVEGDFTARRRANERRHRATPEPERLGTLRRFTTTEPPTSFVPGSRPLDIEEFQHGPFRATLERLERRELQEHQIIMERQAEIDRLRSRLDELQSLERSSASSRVPTLPPLRFDREPLVSETPHRVPSSTPLTNIDSHPFRADIEAAHRRRNWQRGRGSRPWLHPSDEPAPWRSSTTRPTPSAAVPIPRAHTPLRSRTESLDPHPLRPRPETLELLSFGDVDEYLDNLVAPPLVGGTITDSIFARNLTRLREEPPTVDGQQSRREPRGSPPGNLDPGVRPSQREPHADALRGIRPLWASQALGPWGNEVRDEMLTSGLSAGTPTDATVRGRRRRANQSTLPSQGRNGSEDERPAATRRTSSTSRYAATRRTIRDPLLERVQRMVRGGSRESGFYGRYGRRNPGDFIRDEDFDTSYENLLSLAATIGEVRPRHTPEHVIELLPTAMFKEWRNAESDQRCPICLDDYQEDDRVMKLSECSHWLHKNCLQQWLRGATTCPVCRQRVGGPPPCRREREARAAPSSGLSRGIERSDIDINREIQEHVRMAFPNIAAAVRAEAGPSNGGSDAGRDVGQDDGDAVDMTTLDWGGIANAI